MINICKRSVKRAILQSYNIVVGLYKLWVPSSTTAGLDYSSQLSSAGCQSGGILYGIEWESGSCGGGGGDLINIKMGGMAPPPGHAPPRLPRPCGQCQSQPLSSTSLRDVWYCSLLFPASQNLTCYWTLFTKIAWLHLVFAHSSIVFLIIID